MGRTRLYYISTSTVNAQGILVATYTGQLFLGNFQGVQANGSTVLASGCSGTTCTTATPTYLTISAPLPNGTTGTPPKWTDGLLFGGTVDGTTFYGTISNAPNNTPRKTRWSSARAARPSGRASPASRSPGRPAIAGRCHAASVRLGAAGAGAAGFASRARRRARRRWRWRR